MLFSANFKSKRIKLEKDDMENRFKVPFKIADTLFYAFIGEKNSILQSTANYLLSKEKYFDRSEVLTYPMYEDSVEIGTILKLKISIGKQEPKLFSFEVVKSGILFHISKESLQAFGFKDNIDDGYLDAIE